MQTRRFRNLFSVVLIMAIATLFYGCNQQAFKVELPEKPAIIDEIIQ